MIGCWIVSDTQWDSLIWLVTDRVAAWSCDPRLGHRGIGLPLPHVGTEWIDDLSRLSISCFVMPWPVDSLQWGGDVSSVSRVTSGWKTGGLVRDLSSPVAVWSAMSAPWPLSRPHCCFPCLLQVGTVEHLLCFLLFEQANLYIHYLWIKGGWCSFVLFSV